MRNVSLSFKHWITGKRMIRVMEVAGVALGIWLAVVEYIIPRFMPPDSYEIVIAGPMTGPDSSLWQDLLFGVDLALSERNYELRNRLSDRKVEIIRRDDRGDPAEGEVLATELVDRREVVAVIGPFQSSVAEAALRVYRDSNVPVILPSSTNPDLTRQNLKDGVGNVFRLAATDEKQVQCLAEFIKLIAAKLSGEGHENDLTMVIIQDTSNPKYANYIGESLEKRLEECLTCPRILQRKQIDVGTQDYVTMDMVNARAELLVYVGGYQHAVKTLRQARALDWTPTAVLTDACVNSHLHREVPEGTYVTSPMAKYVSLSEQGEPPGFRAFGYDSMRLLSSAILSIDRGPLSRRKILRELDEYKLSTFEDGQAGEYHFNANGDNEHARFHVWQVSGGGWKHAEECPLHTTLLRGLSASD